MLRVFPGPAFVVDENGAIMVVNHQAEGFFELLSHRTEEYEGFANNADGKIIVCLDKLAVLFSDGYAEWAFLGLLNEKYKVSGQKIKVGNKSLACFRVIVYSISDNNEGIKNIDEVTNVFLANLSHEIRTPLNGIIGFAELMAKKNIAPEKQKEYANIIYNNGTYLLKLVSDLLDLSRLESGKLQLYKTQFSVNRLLYDLQLFFLLDMKNRNKGDVMFRVITGLPDGPDLILADEMRLKQIIINLVSNAIKFTNKGEICLKYKIVSGSMLEFSVSDTGRGMTENEQSMIFDRFRQANDSIAKEFGGTGLGLAISKEFVEMHGGTIWIESELDKGSSFYFTIPIR